jgi:predicted PurR-regulated permease PerM
VVFAFFKKEHAEKIWSVVNRSLKTFSDFFDGKMIDSLIVGVLCFLSMMFISFFGVVGFSDCALLVSIIVGVTNMIPYFGPFIGGIPSVLLICIYSPRSALIFAILIIILQQLDGNLIGPKILGESTGLRPLWIIFAITIGGWFAGVIGMLLGVPCVAVITGLMEDSVNKRLKEKQIDMPIINNEKVRKKADKTPLSNRIKVKFNSIKKKNN